MLSDRQLAAVRFLAVPKDEQIMTKEAFCQMMDIPVRTLTHWQTKNEEFKLALRHEQEEIAKHSKDAIAVKLRTLAMEHLYNEMQGAEGETKRKYIATILTETKDADEHVGAVSFDNFSDIDIIQMYMGLDLDAPGVDREELQKLSEEIGKSS